MALNPIDNTLHWIDNNVVLKMTASQHVQVVAGQPQHCAAQQQQYKSSGSEPASHITSFAFGPAGQLYLVEKPGINTTRLVEVGLNGRSEPMRCVKSDTSGSSSDPASCSVPTSISSLAVSADGAVYVADKQLLQIFSLEYVTPQPDPLSGEYSIAWPALNEIIVFNRYGQHVTTKEPATGNIKTTFSYTRNGPSGRLMAIIDSRGNKLDFVRDNAGEQLIQSIETSAAVKSYLTVSRTTGALTHINSSNNCFTLFDYDPVSKLLAARTESDGLTTVYRYDVHGRLLQTVLPDGERFTFTPPSTFPIIRVRLERENPSELAVSGSKIQSGEGLVSFDLQRNGSSFLEWASGSRYSFQPIGDASWSEKLQWSSGSPVIRRDWVQVGNKARSTDKTVKINGVKFLVAESDVQSSSMQLYDGDRQLVMGLQCNTQGYVKELRLPPGFHGIRYNYDGCDFFFFSSQGSTQFNKTSFSISHYRNGRLQGWIWGQRQESYSYDTRGLLAETRTRSEGSSSGSRTITYGPHDLVSAYSVEG